VAGWVCERAASLLKGFNAGMKLIVPDTLEWGAKDDVCVRV
jgi:hypothetical protein